MKVAAKKIQNELECGEDHAVVQQVSEYFPLCSRDSVSGFPIIFRIR